MLSLVFAFLKFVVTAKFAAGVATGSFFVPKGWFGKALAWVKAKFAKKTAA